MESINLTNHFLIAMPAMADPHFARALTLICEHNQQGALGVVVNRPTDMTLGALFDQVEISLDDRGVGNLPVYFGGPVQVDRGFVLHRPVGGWQSTLSVGGELGLTTSRDILEALGHGQGP
jgi:putative transcriptional regulator